MSLFLTERPRRNRKSPAVRGFARETVLTKDALIYPLFVHAGRGAEPIGAMPGCLRHDEDSLLAEAESALKLGLRSVVLFPKVDEAKKSADGAEAFNPEGLIPHMLRRLKQELPELCLVTDVALDPYSSDGHDGIVKDGRILNDASVEVLVKQALAQAEAGADIIAPSDMMDGRVGAIREALDDEGYEEVSIMAYSAKYASAFYGPFRDALGSAPKAGDKKTYQMDPANHREALLEAELDANEGADLLMVKPAGPYLDVIRQLADRFAQPIAAYQVSGEFAMIKAAAAQGWLDERACALESLLGIRRAGASAILTYFAKDVAGWLSE